MRTVPRVAPRKHGIPRAAPRMAISQRTPWGGGKRGGWKTSRMTPLPKGGFWTPPPSYGTFSTPLRCQCSVFPVQKSTTEQTRSSFGGVQKFSGERVLWYVFLPPYVCTPPPYHGPNFTPRALFIEIGVVPRFLTNLTY